MRAPLTAAAALFVAALPAAAEGPRLLDAWAAADAEWEGLIDDAEAANINVIAWHAAVARTCDGYELDVEEIAAATDAILLAPPDAMEAEALLERHASILIALGTAQGLFLAEGALDRDGFCAAAAEVRADPDFDDLWR